MKEITIKVHEIAVDGLPPANLEGGSGLSGEMVGRVAFLFDGNIVNGWPLRRELHPHLYTEEAIYQRSGLAQSIGLSQDEKDKILDQCGRSSTLWEADSDVGKGGAFCGVTHWVEFPTALWNLE